MEENFDQRLSEQVTTLSTKLVTEVARLLEFEEALLQARKENATLKSGAENYASVSSNYEELKRRNEQLIEEHGRLQKEHQVLQGEKDAAEEKNKQLEGEVEDLTASLFNEANEMVSNASREAYNFKLKNRKLIEELSEKDSIIGNLQDELKSLKELFIKIEEQARNTNSRANTPKTHGPNSERFTEDDEPRQLRGSLEVEENDDLPDDTAFVLDQLIYGPKTRSIRLDLQNYQHDFKGFAYQMIRKDFSFDLASLKALKYFKKIWSAEIEPSLGTVPALTGATFMNRWSKGKTFWSLIVEGKAVIEPVAGINETFKLSYKGAKSGNVPVALREPCGICGELKDDLLEHARLYLLKLYGPAADSLNKSSGATVNIAGETHDVVGNYPLCNYCLVKLRAICDFFAKLRSIHSNIYRLQQNLTFENSVYVNNFQFKRASSESLQVPSSNPEDEPVLIKLYLLLLVLRAKIFWAGIGFWDTLEDIESVNFDEIKSEIFKRFIRENVAFARGDLEEVPCENEKTTEKGVTEDAAATVEHSDAGKDEEAIPKSSDPTIEGETSDATVIASEVQVVAPRPEPAAAETLLESGVQDTSQGNETEPAAESAGITEKTEGASGTKVNELVKKLNNGESPVKKGKKKNKAKPKEVKVKEDSENDEDVFQDSEEFPGDALSRRKLKSKAFKKKINKDLDNTLSMLQESIE